MEREDAFILAVIGFYLAFIGFSFSPVKSKNIEPYKIVIYNTDTTYYKQEL